MTDPQLRLYSDLDPFDDTFDTLYVEARRLRRAEK